MENFNPPLRNIRIKLAYDGGKFNGWQRHSSGDGSVEDSLFKAIYEIIGEEVVLVCASCTDRGVHACEQVVNFRTNSEIEVKRLKQKLRDKLDFIYVLSVEEAPLFFHSRQNSIGKKYIYQIWNAKHIEKDYLSYCWHLKEELNVNLMKKYTSLFIGTKDFRNFSRETGEKNTIKTIFDINIKKIKQLILIEIRGSGFLYNMVRCIIAIIVGLTYGKVDIKDVISGNFKFIIAPPEGLFLDKVYY